MASAFHVGEMSSTELHEVNRGVFVEHGPDEEHVAGMALRVEQKVADKIS